MNLIAFSLCFIFNTHFTIGAENYSEKELLEIGKGAIEKISTAKSPNQEKAAFRNALIGLSDSQKIRAIAYWVLETDDDPKYNMRSSNSAVPAYALGQDQKIITDWSELRNMLKETKDPRKFFLISGLVPWSNNEYKHDFIYELTHMLFADGRVAKDEGEYTKDYADDVSEYAYAAIIGNLRMLGADFEPPAKDLAHEEQALILAKWLKENWQGCEDLEIPGQTSSKVSRPDKRNQGIEISLVPTANGSNEMTSRTENAEQEGEKFNWLWIFGGVMLLVVIFFLVTLVVKTR